MNEEQKYILDKTLSRFDNYMNNINAKAAFVITFNTFLLGAIIFKYENVIQLFNHSKIIILVYITIFCLFIGICISLICCLFAVKPYLESGNDPGNYNSLIFFGSIAKMNKDTYTQNIETLNNQIIMNDLCCQNYIMAKGLAAKYNYISRSFMSIFLLELIPICMLTIFRIVDWIIK